MTPPLTRYFLAAMIRELTLDLTPEGRLKTALAAALLAAWDERDAVQKEFDAVVAMLSEMHGAEYSRAEAAEAKLAERDAEIARLRDAATAWQAFKDAHTVTDHWASVDRLDRALLDKEPKP